MSGCSQDQTGTGHDRNDVSFHSCPLKGGLLSEVTRFLSLDQQFFNNLGDIKKVENARTVLGTRSLNMRQRKMLTPRHRALIRTTRCSSHVRDYPAELEDSSKRLGF